MKNFKDVFIAPPKHMVWVAQDADGEVYAYTEEPALGNIGEWIATRSSDVVLVGTGDPTDKPSKCLISKLPNLEKPPLEIKPAYLYHQPRIKELEQAVARYIEADKEVPTEWYEEIILLRGFKL